MMTRHSLTALGLCLVLALTSLTLAGARGTAQSVDQIVLCTGAGPVSVPVDANGQPTGPSHLCPDCLPTLIAGPPATPDTTRAMAVTRAAWRIAAAPAPTGYGIAAFTARAPPETV
jgi:hypothetical protein